MCVCLSQISFLEEVTRLKWVKQLQSFFFFSKSQFQLNNCRQSLLFVRLFVPLSPPPPYLLFVELVSAFFLLKCHEA